MLQTQDKEIHAMVKVCATNDSWLFSCIYASTYRNIRNNLWDNLKKVRDSYTGAWLLGGDFNELMSSSDKSGGRPVNRGRVNDF